MYNCSKCPGYCCSYPLIPITKADAERLARHFDMALADFERRHLKSQEGYKRTLRRKKDPHFGSICRFFDTTKRRCTVYKARPGVCRKYPVLKRCGYYDFLSFERRQQGDKDFVAKTHHQD